MIEPREKDFSQKVIVDLLHEDPTETQKYLSFSQHNLLAEV